MSYILQELLNVKKSGGAIIMENEIIECHTSEHLTLAFELMNDADILKNVKINIMNDIDYTGPTLLLNHSAKSEVSINFLDGAIIYPVDITNETSSTNITKLDISSTITARYLKLPLCRIRKSLSLSQNELGVWGISENGQLVADDLFIQKIWVTEEIMPSNDKLYSDRKLSFPPNIALNCPVSVSPNEDIMYYPPSGGGNYLQYGQEAITMDNTTFAAHQDANGKTYNYSYKVSPSRMKTAIEGGADPNDFYLIIDLGAEKKIGSVFLGVRDIVGFKATLKESDLLNRDSYYLQASTDMTNWTKISDLWYNYRYSRNSSVCISDDVRYGFYNGKNGYDKLSRLRIGIPTGNNNHSLFKFIGEGTVHINTPRIYSDKLVNDGLIYIYSSSKAVVQINSIYPIKSIKSIDLRYSCVSNERTDLHNIMYYWADSDASIRYSSASNSIINPEDGCYNLGLKFVDGSAIMVGFPQGVTPKDFMSYSYTTMDYLTSMPPASNYQGTVNQETIILTINLSVYSGLKMMHGEEEHTLDIPTFINSGVASFDDDDIVITYMNDNTIQIEHLCLDDLTIYGVK